MDLVPVVDIRTPGATSLAALDTACRDHGFFLLTGHGLDDVIAQTFEAAAHQFARGHGADVSPAWLTVVAKRRLVDHWRHMAARSRAVDRIAGSRQLCFDPPASNPDDDVTAALESLPTRQRTVLTLRYLDDWGLDEIADGLGISYRAVESLLARARRSFAAAIDAGTTDNDGWSRRTR